MRGGSGVVSGDKARAYVLDATAIIVGATEHRDVELYTTLSVISEVKGDAVQVARAEAMLSSGSLKLASPSKVSVEEVRRVARAIGKHLVLSPTDVEIVALALDLSKIYDVLVITDDYAVQSVAEALRIAWRGLKYRGIRKAE